MRRVSAPITCALVCACTGLFTLQSYSAVAADGSADAADVPGSGRPNAREQENGAVPEIVVTATKREQNLNAVGLSVAALSSDDLAAMRINDAADLARVTPGLQFAQTANDTPVYTLRGVGFYEQSLAAYPDVSLYLDQAPLPLPILASLTVFDLERVEVLKGPQGTLFGNNATGGAINYVAAKPTKDFQARFQAGYANYDTVELAGFVSGPLSDRVRARFAVHGQDGDGWQYSVSRADTIGRKNNWAGRFLLDWDVTDGLTFALDLNGWLNKNDPQGWQVSGLDIKNPPGSAGFGGVMPSTAPVLSQPVIPDGNLRATDWTPQYRPFTDNRYWQITGRADWALSDLAQLTSITGYQRFSLRGRQDEDGSALALFGLDNHNGYINSVTQELRLAGHAGRLSNWVVGTNYEQTHTGEYYDLQTFDSSSAFVNGAALNRNDNYQRMRNYAAFGNIEYEVASATTLKLGVRQSRADRDSNVAGYSLPGVPPPAGVPYTYTQFFNLIYGYLYPGLVPPIQEGQSFLIDTRVKPDGSPVNPSTYLKTGRYYGQLSENSTSWSVGLDTRPADGLLLYANVSKGYKSGSFPLLAAAIFEGLEPVKQESLLDYEAGVKTQLLNRKLQMSGALFYYDYRNKQVLTKFIDPIFGALDKLQNVPKSTVKGAEIELTARPIAALTLSASATYLDATVDEYIGANGYTVAPNGLRRPVLLSFAGARLPFAPRFQYVGRAVFDQPLPNSLAYFVDLAAHGQSASYASLAATQSALDDTYIAPYTLVDAGVGLRSQSDRWRVTVWGKNVFDRYYVVNRFTPYDAKIRLTGDAPRYGVTVQVNL